MTAGVIRAHARPDMFGGVRHWVPAPIDPLVVHDAARLLVAAILVLLALAGMVVSGTYLAGPVPVAGPAPGLAL